MKFILFSLLHNIALLSPKFDVNIDSFVIINVIHVLPENCVSILLSFNKLFISLYDLIRIVFLFWNDMSFKEFLGKNNLKFDISFSGRVVVINNDTS